MRHKLSPVGYYPYILIIAGDNALYLHLDLNLKFHITIKPYDFVFVPRLKTNLTASRLGMGDLIMIECATLGLREKKCKSTLCMGSAYFTDSPLSVR